MTEPLADSPLRATSDEELVARTLGGDRRAFNVLIIRHERRLFRLLSRMASNNADVEDAMQQALIKSYIHLARYNPRWSFATWLYAIALRELRTIQRRPKPIALSGDSPAPSSTEHSNDLWHTVKKILSPNQYTVLWLTYGEGLHVRDVARIIARPRVWVSVTLHRARNILKQNVGRDGEILNRETNGFTLPRGRQAVRGVL